MVSQNPTPDENFDWTAAEQELTGAEVVDLTAARQRRDNPAAGLPAVPDDPAAPTGPTDVPDREVLEGEIVTAQVTDAPPELKQWAWAVGWRHKARRLWTYKWRYLWNTFVVLGAWSVRASGWWFRGIGRSVNDFFNYVDDRQALAVADQAAGAVDGRADVDAWLKARAERHREVKDRRRVVRSRTILPLAALIALVVLLLWLGRGDMIRSNLGHATMTAWVGLGCWLVWYGRARSVPFLPQFREPSPYPPVTHDSVTGALLATGIGQFRDVVKAGHSPVDVIFRDDSAGGKIAETHPIPGVTTQMVMAKSVVIAGALKRPPAMVHLSQAPTGVPGHVEILVLDIDPGQTKPKRFAYLGKPVNVGAPCTIGYDPRNRPVRWPLPGANGITTGTPGSGKTAYLIGLACLAAADVDGAQLAVFDFKGMGDYAELEPVCFAYGADADPTETARMLVGFLTALKREIIRRRQVLTDLKKIGSEMLDNNAAALTDRLARSSKHNMPWILVIIDEIHEGLGDPIHGKDIAALLTDLMKIGRACGIHVELASQRTDTDSIPTSISSLPIVRVAFHQNGQPGNDMILGTGAYKRGVDATAFRRGAAGTAADDRGSCWYIGSEGGEPVRVRTTFVLPDVKRIVATALAGRTKAGTLTGAAAGIVEQADTAPAHSALDDVRAVFIGDEIALHGDVIFHRVETRHPGRWKSQAALIAALKGEAPGWKSPTVDVHQLRPADAPVDAGIEKTRRGIRLNHLETAITERDNRQGG
ncbi:FtsK/SpoIIIE domain-containing protein [Actinoplanes sp. CA-252034]|uniref:FtsK/SpoIIIE domain-containing protein n=1 Tax=Actinoplanes sp. CA-252034 TaxID=3239906 RepID=UPI003D95113B